MGSERTPPDTEDEMREIAERFWGALGHALDNRGCFNGIDDDVMDELNASMLELVTANLRASRLHPVQVTEGWRTERVTIPEGAKTIVITIGTAGGAGGGAALGAAGRPALPEEG